MISIAKNLRAGFYNKLLTQSQNYILYKNIYICWCSNQKAPPIQQDNTKIDLVSFSFSSSYNFISSLIDSVSLTRLLFKDFLTRCQINI